MQGDVRGTPDHARRRFGPVTAAPTGEIIPAERLRIVAAVGPERKAGQILLLPAPWLPRLGTVARFRRQVFHAEASSHSNEEDALPLLRQPVVPRIDHIVLYDVAGPLEKPLLALQHLSVAPEGHPDHVFHDEGEGPDLVQCPAKLEEKEVDTVVRLPPTALAESLAGVTSYEQFGGRKMVDVPDVSFVEVDSGHDEPVCVARRLPPVIGPYYVNAEIAKAEVTSATTTEQ